MYSCTTTKNYQIMVFRFDFLISLEISIVSASFYSTFSKLTLTFCCFVGSFAKWDTCGCEMFGEFSKRIGEFLNEVKVIMGIHHENLVKLKEYCVRDAKWQLFVYEYVESKDLHEVLWPEGTIWFKPWLYKIMKQHIFFNYLHAKSTKMNHVFANWANRRYLDLGLANAIQYMHGNCSRAW